MILLNERTPNLHSTVQRINEQAYIFSYAAWSNAQNVNFSYYQNNSGQELAYLLLTLQAAHSSLLLSRLIIVFYIR